MRVVFIIQIHKTASLQKTMKEERTGYEEMLSAAGERAIAFHPAAPFIILVYEH
jgi:hypothetical protein